LWGRGFDKRIRDACANERFAGDSRLRRDGFDPLYNLVKVLKCQKVPSEDKEPYVVALLNDLFQQDFDYDFLILQISQSIQSLDLLQTQHFTVQLLLYKKLYFQNLTVI
jgi:hypothetical protein